MKIEYTPETDTLYIEFMHGLRVEDAEGEDLNDHTVAFYTAKNELVSLEIEHARKAVNLQEFEVNGQAVPVKVLGPVRRKRVGKRK